MSTIKATWGWAFDSIPGIDPGRGWGSFEKDLLQDPDGQTHQVKAIFLISMHTLRLQLEQGTPASAFPTLVGVKVGKYALEFGPPGEKKTLGHGEARDYPLMTGERPPKYVGLPTEFFFTSPRAGWVDPEPPKPQQDAVAFDADTHTLLRDIAHQELLTETEYPDFETRCREAGLEVIQVTVADWPPVQYSPLALVMSADGGTVSAPWWTKRFWTGVQPAIRSMDRISFTYPDLPELRGLPVPPEMIGRKDLSHAFPNMSDDGETYSMAGSTSLTAAATAARYTGRVMAGNRFAAKRLAYMWQVAEFDLEEHVAVMAWLDENGLDRLKWLREFHPALVKRLGFDPVFDATNPDAFEENEQTGSYEAVIRAIDFDHQGPVLEDYRRESEGKPARRRPVVTDSAPPPPPPTPPAPPTRTPAVVEGAKVYSIRQVADALAAAFGGSLPRLFGNAAADSAIVAMTRDGLVAYKRWSDLDRQAYVTDTGSRNFVCDDFAMVFKSDLARYYGMNCAGIVWGDGHAWNFVIVVGDKGPEIVFVEPQTDLAQDAEIRRFEGPYAIGRRCEIIL